MANFCRAPWLPADGLLPLTVQIDQLWNKFWSGGISNPLTAIEQITYLLFMKRLDEQDQKKIADAEFTGEKYTSKFEGTWIPPDV